MYHFDYLRLMHYFRVTVISALNTSDNIEEQIVDQKYAHMQCTLRIEITLNDFYIYYVLS